MTLEETTAVSAPFRDAIGVQPLSDGRFGAELGTRWTIAGKAHGGLLMVLVGRAAEARLAAEGSGVAREPLAVSANYLRAPDPGPVVMDTEVLKVGRSASVVSVRLRQGDRVMLTATVTAGRLPAEPPRWSAVPELPAEPVAGAVDPGTAGQHATLGSVCDLRYDPATLAFARGEHGPPVLRAWARPRGEPTDLWFTLLAGDILAPTVFNVTGRVGWAPTVQLTTLLRARPEPGWLRMEGRSTSIAGGWFDEDVTVIDAAGRLVGQARQLALTPLDG